MSARQSSLEVWEKKKGLEKEDRVEEVGKNVRKEKVEDERKKRQLIIIIIITEN